MATKKTTSTTAKIPTAKKADARKVEVAPAQAKANAQEHREPKVAPEKKLSQFQAAIKVPARASEP